MFTMLLVNALQAAGAVRRPVRGLLAVDDLRPVQRLAGRDLRALLPAARDHAALHDERVPDPRQRLLPFVRRDPRAAVSSIDDDLALLTKNLGQFLSPRSRSRARSRLPVPRRDHASDRSRAPPNLDAFALVFAARGRSRRSCRDLVRWFHPRLGTSFVTRSRRSAIYVEPRQLDAPDKSQKTEDLYAAAPGGAARGPGRERGISRAGTPGAVVSLEGDRDAGRAGRCAAAPGHGHGDRAPRVRPPRCKFTATRR